MATLAYESLKVRDTTEEVYVSNNDIARLMYYLSCVCSVIQMNIPEKFTNYKEYYDLTWEEENTVINLALICNPKILTENSIFLIDDDFLKMSNTSNRFYQITDEKFGVHINEDIVIGGKITKVLKIMVCKKTWLVNYYLNPLENLNHRITNERTSYSNNYSTNHSYNYSENNRRACCSKRNVIIAVVLIIIFIAICSNQK